MAITPNTQRAEVAQSLRPVQRTNSITRCFIAMRKSGLTSLAGRAKWFPLVFATVLMLSIPKMGWGQSSCFCIGSFSICNNCPLACNATGGTAACPLTSCANCTYVGIYSTGASTCCFTSLNITSNECFTICGFLRDPFGDFGWGVGPTVPDPLWVPGQCSSDGLTLSDGSGSHPFCGSNCTCTPPTCDGPLIIFKVCGTFPMTITITGTDNCGNNCSQNLYIP
jgi:hypothetical protein